MKFSSKKPTTVVGLDIETGSVAATEVNFNGSTKIGRTGIAPLNPGITREGEVTDPEELGAMLKDLFGQQKLAKTVRVGVANQKVVVRVLRMPLIEEREELETAIRFQAPDHLPMPLEEAVLDWQVLARGVGDEQRQMDVVLVAARREMVSRLAQALRVAGLRPLGVDVAAFGMIRALAHEPAGHAAGYEQGMADGGEPGDGGELSPARLYCSLGDVTNLAVARGSVCLFTRVSSVGLEGIAQKLAERRGLTLEHARQWLAHVGLRQPVEEIEGDSEIVAATREVLAAGASSLANELRLSLDYYGTQEGALAVEEIVACGPGTAIDGLDERLEHELGFAFRVGRPEALSHLDPAAAARLTLSYGLALEE